MSRKNLISLAVIVVMLGGSAFILYRGFFAKPGTPPASPTNAGVTPPGTESSVSNINASLPPAAISGQTAGTAVTPLDIAKILPLGTRFDLTLIKKYNADTRTNNYPVVQPEEIGPALNALVKEKNE